MLDCSVESGEGWPRSMCVVCCVLCVVCVCAHVREHANTCLGLNSASQVHSESSELRGMLLCASLP